MIDTNQRVAILKKIHLFVGLKDDQFAAMAAKFVERELPANQTVFKRGDKPDGFYIVFRGKVDVVRPGSKKDNEVLIWLVAGDYFGEEALVENRDRSATITTVEPTTLLFLTRAHFEELLVKYPNLKPNFLVAIKSHKLARATKFDWLGPKEIIYFVARRHKIRLYQALVVPVLSLIVPIGLFAWGTLVSATTPIALGVLALIFIVFWAGWNALDWSNDYYIVTNQRVIWLEKVIGIYDSREEAPLSTILSVGVETDQLGRMLDFGNVIVRTFVGRLEFDYVDHPNQAAEMIREYWERVKSVLTVSQKEVMNNTIRQKLGLPVEKKKLDELPPVVNASKSLANQPLWWLAFRSLFTLRTEDAGKVIYHKHWVVLLQQSWRPLTFLLGFLALQIWRGLILWNSPTEGFLQPNSAGALRPDTIMVALPMLSLPFLAWLIWEYVDWKNDIFMITQDEIFDMDRKPFGKEEKRAAQIESILNTSYTREGPIAYLLNYGTVKITVGGAEFDFQDVADPAGVQADINRRRMVRIAKKNEDAGKDDRERFATWIAAYHENVDSFKAAPIIVPKDDEKKDAKK
ncbi:MAG: cyclic nucleotide-binding domain-containing protein [Anaerolineales bacterium]|nr:cyclic nucleotide-binding domain-containing protein [Anaerolineales bacterium]MBP6210274.1 cyclic nucleotide-binding domain-containing protein [Anaerolineales bacterium]